MIGSLAQRDFAHCLKQISRHVPEKRGQYASEPAHPYSANGIEPVTIRTPAAFLTLGRLDEATRSQGPDRVREQGATF